MRVLYVMFIGLLLPFSSFAGDGGLASGELTLSNFAGVYRGYSPTDGSALAVGEIELTLTKEKMNIRMATGLTILDEEIPLNDFVEMTKAELTEFYSGSGFAERSIGFKGPSGAPQLVFLKNPSTSRLIPARSEFGLVVRTGGMADYLGPTVFLTPQQLQKVSCERFLRSTEFWSAGSWKGGLIPRLNNNGLAPNR